MGVGDDKSKCKDNVPAQKTSEQILVANQDECQAKAVKANVEWYSFRQNAEDGKHRCTHSKSCKQYTKGATNMWQRFYFNAPKKVDDTQLAQTRHSAAGTGRGLESLSSMLMLVEDETNVKCQSQKWIELAAGREEQKTSCNAESTNKVAAPALWSQVGDDKSKCKDNVPAQKTSEQILVANQDECQANAVKANVEWYSFRQNAEDGKHKCTHSKSCEKVKTTGTNMWRIFNSK